MVWASNRKAALRVLMDQCSRHDTPSVLSATLTNQPGHGLSAEIDSLNVQVLTGRRLGHHTATAKRSPRDVPPLERAVVKAPRLLLDCAVTCRIWASRSTYGRVDPLRSAPSVMRGEASNHRAANQAGGESHSNCGRLCVDWRWFDVGGVI